LPGISDESQNLGAQVIQREKIATLEQLAHQVTSPDFDLIHPRCMFGSVREHDLVRLIMQKGCATFHRLEDATLAFDAQALRCDDFLFSYPALRIDGYLGYPG